MSQDYVEIWILAPSKVRQLSVDRIPLNQHTRVYVSQYNIYIHARVHMQMVSQSLYVTHAKKGKL